MNNLPNKITTVRIALVPLILFFYLSNLFSASKLIALILFIIASFTDFLDGYIARKYNMITTLGKFLDPIADKLIAICGVLLVITSNVMNLYFGVILAFLMVSRDTIVDFLRIIASSKNVIISADKWGKLKTVSLSVFVPIFMLIDANASLNFLNNFAINILYTLGYLFAICYVVLLIFSCVNYLVKNKKIFE